MKYICDVCGKEFESDYKGYKPPKRCSASCRRLAEKRRKANVAGKHDEMLRRLNKELKAIREKSRFEENSKAADALGVSYGKYIAMKEGRI